MSSKLITIILLLHTSLTLKCRQNILEAYGLDGLEESKEMEFNMCPDIQESCCEFEDQLIIYDNWIKSNEKKILENHYKIFTKFYTKIMQVFLIASNKAKNIEEIQKTKQIGNCKLLAERILNYELETSHEDVLESLENLDLFFNTTYSGFYCSICDAKYQKNLDSKKSKIFFSKKFCRNIVENLLGPLMYLKNHLKVLANLVSHFLTSCNFEGDYTIVEIPEDFIFVINDKELVELNRCKKWRNEKDWFLFCKPICSRFDFVSYNKYFEMDSEKLEGYVNYTKQKIIEIEQYVKENPIKAGSRILENEKIIKKVVKKNFSKRDFGRILADETNKKNEKKNFDSEKKNFEEKKIKEDRKLKLEKQRIFDKKLIFQNTSNATIKLNAFKTDFSDDGIEFYKYGLSTRINLPTLNQVKMMIKLKKENEPNTLENNSVSGNLKISLISFSLLILFFRIN